MLCDNQNNRDNNVIVIMKFLLLHYRDSKLL